MSQGNASAAIGLANTNKIPSIGVYTQDQTPPGPGDDGPHFGVQGITSWTYNWLGEDPGYLAPSTHGAAAGKNAQWVTFGASPIVVSGTGLMTVSAGTAAAGAGTWKTNIPSGVTIPAGSFFWVFDNT